MIQTSVPQAIAPEFKHLHTAIPAADAPDTDDIDSTDPVTEAIALVTRINAKMRTSSATLTPLGVQRVA